MQAQDGPMSFVADKDLTVASVNGKVRVSAAKELVLESGGAFIQMTDGSITLGGPLDLFFKTITVQKKGEASQGPDLPVLPSGKVGDLPHFLEISHHYDDLEPVGNAPYRVRLRDGTTLSGTLDDKGFARLDGVPAGRGTVELAEDARQWTGESKRPNNDAGAAIDAQSAITLARKFLS
jgi:type VI secretion system secreted protein VgrG